MSGEEAHAGDGLEACKMFGESGEFLEN